MRMLERVETEAAALLADVQPEARVEAPRLLEVRHGQVEMVHRVYAKRFGAPGRSDVVANLRHVASPSPRIFGAVVRNSSWVLLRRFGSDGQLINDRIDQHAEAFELDLADVARLHPQRRLPSEAYARGRAGDDDVARLERECH